MVDDGEVRCDDGGGGYKTDPAPERAPVAGGRAEDGAEELGGGEGLLDLRRREMSSLAVVRVKGA
jgi:hypothetical protein